MNKTLKITLTSLFAAASIGVNAASNDELLAKISQLETQLKGLANQVQANNNYTNTHIKEQQAQIEAVATQVESTTQQGSKTHISGYGELHYNNLKNDTNGKTKDEIDFHRFVLEFGHDFSDKTRFFSELELEHAIAGEGKKGEIELEQAYIEHDFNESVSGRAGVVLIPVGILNETHEPTAFYGVERNPVEKNIIPATWWAAGIGVSGHSSDGLSYDLLYHEGLEVPDSFKIRSGRQKTGKAVAKDFATTARLKYTGIAGLELAATYQHQQDFAQGNTFDDDNNTATATVAIGGSANLFETHVAYNSGPLTLKALYAKWKLNGNAAKAANKDKQDGYYYEAGYKITPKLGVFARYNEWDNGGDGDTTKKQTDYGVNYWLEENVVFKADIQTQSGKADDDGFNLGLGYQF
ncbi:FIG01060344: hypothetical protein [uncultured Candidatus Thioglobus sp.]|nr:FIG01060344: hypothetical protein [uncultured Candidatus Thioglobus sp.]